MKTDHLATCDMLVGEYVWVAMEVPTDTLTGNDARLLAFSDGASGDAAQGWGAFVAAATPSAWKIVAARIWRGPASVRTVPVLEAQGIAAAAGLLRHLVVSGGELRTEQPLLSLPVAVVQQAQRHLQSTWRAAWPD